MFVFTYARKLEEELEEQYEKNEKLRDEIFAEKFKYIEAMNKYIDAMTSLKQYKTLGTLEYIRGLVEADKRKEKNDG